MFKSFVSLFLVLVSSQLVSAQAVLIEDPANPNKTPTTAKSLVNEASSWFSNSTNDISPQTSIKISSEPSKSFENSILGVYL